MNIGDGLSLGHAALGLAVHLAEPVVQVLSRVLQDEHHTRAKRQRRNAMERQDVWVRHPGHQVKLALELERRDFDRVGHLREGNHLERDPRLARLVVRSVDVCEFSIAEDHGMADEVEAFEKGGDIGHAAPGSIANAEAHLLVQRRQPRRHLALVLRRASASSPLDVAIVLDVPVGADSCDAEDLGELALLLLVRLAVAALLLVRCGIAAVSSHCCTKTEGF